MGQGENEVATAVPDEPVVGAAEAPKPAVVDELAAAPEPKWSCPSCRAGFAEHSEYRKHAHASVACFAEPWQAVVRSVACLPGVGTALWCPACPDSFVGKWSGVATKSAALLR